MKIATLLFTFNRSHHTEHVLEALKHNYVLPQKLFVFQDGLKEDIDEDEWKKVNRLIHEINWCDKEIIVSENNKGLAKSIVTGINYVFQEYNAVIVLEDDCVPAKNFMSFMQQCFEKYENDKRIYSVTGYAWPIDLQKSEYDVYGCGRISSWGWGTWKDRWDIFEKDYEIISKMKKDKELSQKLALWGSDLEDTLMGNVRGVCDSWAVFWALNVILRNGICINPYYSLIRNIGCDGSGVHCGRTDRYLTEMMCDEKQKFDLPDQMNVSKEIERAFVPLFGNSSAINGKEKEGKENILVYGLGNYFHEREDALNKQYNIVAIIDNHKNGYYAGKKVIRPKNIKSYAFDRIVVVVKNIGECISIAKSLIKEFAIPYEIIEISNFTEFEKLIVNEDGTLTVMWKNLRIRVESLDEYNNVWEVFINQSYCYAVNRSVCKGEGKATDVVIDIGMNIGDSVLYFLGNSKVAKVFAFEPFRETYLRAEENIKENNVEQDKVCMFPYGLSDCTEERIINYNKGMSCGQSSLQDCRELAYANYTKLKLVNVADEKNEIIQVKKASDVIAKILEEYTGFNIILKMDCEGEEYGIIKNLFEERLLEKIDFIMMEWHYKGNRELLIQLEERGFSYWCIDKNKNMGLIYAYRTCL